VSNRELATMIKPVAAQAPRINTNRYIVNTRTLTFAKEGTRPLSDGEIVVEPPSRRALEDACDGRDMMAIYEWVTT